MNVVKVYSGLLIVVCLHMTCERTEATFIVCGRPETCDVEEFWRFRSWRLSCSEHA